MLTVHCYGKNVTVPQNPTTCDSVSKTSCPSPRDATETFFLTGSDLNRAPTHSFCRFRHIRTGRHCGSCHYLRSYKARSSATDLTGAKLPRCRYGSVQSDHSLSIRHSCRRKHVNNFGYDTNTNTNLFTKSFPVPFTYWRLLTRHSISKETNRGRPS